jgi:hypothetical protein
MSMMKYSVLKEKMKENECGWSNPFCLCNPVNLIIVKGGIFPLHLFCQFVILRCLCPVVLAR